MKKIIVPDEALEDYHMILELEYLRNEVKELKIIVKKQREYLLMYESADRAIDRMIDKARGK